MMGNQEEVKIDGANAHVDMNRSRPQSSLTHDTTQY